MSIPPSLQRRDADECAPDDPERDQDHVGHVGRTIGDADIADRVGDAPRRADERHDVAAMQCGRRKHRHRRAGTHNPAEKHAACRFVAREVGQRSAVDLGAGHNDVQHFRRDVEQFPIVDLRTPSRGPSTRSTSSSRRP